MPGPEQPTNRKKIAAALALLLFIGVLALLFWPESPDSGGPDHLAMPGSGSGSAMASRSRSTALFGSQEGITPATEAGTREFFRRLAEALAPSSASSERSRLLELLMADPDVQRMYRELIKHGRVPDPQELAERLKQAGIADRLLAELREQGPGAQRMLVQGNLKDTPPAPPPPPKPASKLRDQASASAMAAQVFKHIFSMVTPPKRDAIFAKMETGAGVWDACRQAGLAGDCNAAAVKCGSDEGCVNWLKQTGQSLPGGETALLKATDRKTVSKKSSSDADANDAEAKLQPTPTPEPRATTTGGGTDGGNGGGGDGGGHGGGGSTGEPTREEICAEKPWKSFCPGHEDYDDPPPAPPSPPNAPPPPPPPPPREPPPPRCFIAGTKVLTPSGPRDIEDIRIGDGVIAFDLETNRRVTAPVLALVRGVESRFVRFRLSDGRVLQVTPKHRFYDPTGKTWVEAEHLKVGAPLLGSTPAALAAAPEGRPEVVVVAAIELLESRPRPVYNLTVEAPYHNYFAEGVLVHNRKDPDGRGER